jgi:WS/DGAT/MGAT family acyltransferase
MDQPSNLMMINGVLLFDRPLSFDRLREVFRDRLLPLERFRHRVVASGSGRARWVPAESFDLDRHLLRERLPEPRDEAALERLVGEKMSVPLDPHHPLWQFHYVENYAEGSALIGRIHHCIGDGLGLMIVLLALTDLDEEGVAGNPFLELLRDPDGGSGEALDGVRRIMPQGARLLSRPAEVLRALNVWQRGAASSLALARLVFRSSDSKTLLNGTLDLPKRAAWSRRIPVSELEAVRDGIGGTVNDVLLTAMTGGIRRYFARREGESGCRDFRATIPVSLRPLENLATLGNEFGLVYLSLPVAIADPVERLAELRRRMEALKRSAEALVTLRVMALMGRLPAAAQRLLVRLFASKATAVMTNVPGPICTLYMAGAPIQDLIFWVPRSARLSLGVSIFSYAGGVRMGVATDAGLVPDPQRVVEDFHEELDAMADLAGRSGRGGR